MRNSTHIMILYILVMMLAVWSWLAIGVTNDLQERNSKSLEIDNLQDQLADERWETTLKQVEFNDVIIKKFEGIKK